jgi:hypothetical protein
VISLDKKKRKIKKRYYEPEEEIFEGEMDYDDPGNYYDPDMDEDSLD